MHKINRELLQASERAEIPPKHFFIAVVVASSESAREIVCFVGLGPGRGAYGASLGVLVQEVD